MVTGAADLVPCHLWQNISMSINVIFCLWNSDAVEKVKENILPLEQRKKWDVQRWAIYVSERNKEKLPIYLYGQSMGAAAVLMASGYRLPSEVKGLVADCGFQSMERQMRDMADNWFHLHYIPLLLKEMDCLCHFVAGFRMKDADTTEAMKRNTRPVLFFHGEKDTYVYPNNSFQNYMLCKAPKELVIVQGARHLCSAYADPELYQRTVMEFLRNMMAVILKNNVTVFNRQKAITNDNNP